MPIIFKIARNEFRHLIFSPVAWTVLILFSGVCGYFYASPVFDLAVRQDSILANSKHFPGWPGSITTHLFLMPELLFWQVVNNLYFIIPVLTMGIFSRETTGGTYKLLFSTRLKIHQIVWGKYLGMMLFNFLFVVIITIIVISGIFSIQHVEYSVLWSAVLGCFLMIAAYSAIGVFMSSLSTYQIISAVATFTALFVLSRIGTMWQEFDFIRDITWSLSLNGRVAKMISGLISTKDLIYFLVIVFIFTGFAWVRLRSSTESRPWYVATFRYLAVVIMGVTAGYLSARPSLTAYWDVTRGDRNTIHPRTQQLIRQFDKKSPLTVTLYSNLFDGGSILSGLPKGRNAYLTDLWEQYLRFKPDIKFEYVYYYDYDTTTAQNKLLFEMFPGKTLHEIALIKADEAHVQLSRFLPPEQIRKKIDLAPEGRELVMQLQYQNRTEFLRTFAGIWPIEENVAAAFKRLLTGAAPTVTFSTGHLERSPFQSNERDFLFTTAYKSDYTSLINHGFNIDTVSLGYRPIPEATKILVIADPKIPLEERAMAEIRKYVSGGGNMLMLGEPGKQDLLNEVLRQAGVGMQLEGGILIQPSRQETPEKVVASLTPSGLRLADGDTRGFIAYGATAVNQPDSSSFSFTTLVLPGQRKYWLHAGSLAVDSAPPVFDQLNGDRLGEFPISVLATRMIHKKHQKIILCGDADFGSNIRTAPIIRAMYSFLADNSFPIYTPRPEPHDKLLAISATNAYWQKILWIWVVPGLLALTGTTLLFRRKRK